MSALIVLLLSIGLTAAYNCTCRKGQTPDGKCVGEIGSSGAGSVSNLQLWIMTGDNNLGGTDANIFVTIYYGPSASTQEIKLDYRKENTEQGSEDVFSINSNGLSGDPDKIRVRQDDTGKLPGWFVTRLEIKDRKTNICYIIPANRWLATDEPPSGEILRDFPVKGIPGELSVETLTLTIKTSSCSFWDYCGTDANVYVELYWNSGDSGRKVLKISNNANKWENGQTDITRIEVVGLSPEKPLVLSIGHDNSGPGPGWRVDYVDVSSPRFSTVRFNINNWLDKNQGDGEIERTVSASS